MANWPRFMPMTCNNKCRDRIVSLLDELSERPVINIGFGTVTALLLRLQ